MLDSTLVLAVAAAATERIAIGFGVLVVALRGPVWAAKQITTLQAISGNRVILCGYRIPADRARRVPITGSTAQIADRLAEYAAIGVNHLVIGLIGDNWRTTCDRLAQARATLL